MIEWLAGVGYEAPCIECMQEGSHDSAIDARTALDLVHLKIKHGEGVSATHHAWVRFKMCMAVRNRCPLRGEQPPNTYHPSTSHFSLTGPSYGTSEYESGSVAKLVDVLGGHGKRCLLVDRSEALQR